MEGCTMPDALFVQLYRQDGEAISFTGVYFEISDLGNEVPRPGDTVICPLRKADFEPRNPERHFAFEIVRRYFLPDITKSQAGIVKLLVRQRELTSAEKVLCGAKY
jgi:hypothetical protein